MEQIVRFLDAPKLRTDRRWPVFELPVGLMNDIGIVQGDEWDAAPLKWTECVNRIRNSDVRLPVRQNGCNCFGVAAKDRGEVRDSCNGTHNADTAVLDAVIERLNLVQAADARNGFEIPKPVPRGHDLNLGTLFKQALNDRIATGRVAETQPVNQKKKPRGCHQVRFR